MDSLIGRARELEVLRARLRDASGGRGGVVLLTGEAGIGKSALSNLLSVEAKGQGFRVALGRALELGEAPAWFPLRPCLRSIALEPPASFGGEAEIYALWERVLEALVAAAQAGPILWVVEDLHAADAQSLDLVRYLAQPARMLPVLLLGTTRTLGERVGRVAREAQTLELSPLAPTDVREVVERVGGRALEPRELELWMQRTGGNPLFVVECARARRGEGGLPATVVAVVLDRLRSLPATTVGLLEQGAVVGRDFSASVLGRMSARLPAAVIDGLLAALGSGLLDELEPGSFRFTHAIVREAILGAIEPGVRRRLHADAERALSQLGETPERAVARAWHALEAAGAMDPERALRVIDGAIELLDAQGAYDRAYALWRRSHEAGARPNTADRLIDGSRRAARAGLYLEVREHALAALGLAREAGDGRAFAEAALALGVNLRPAVVDPELVRALEEARALMPPDAPALACRVDARYAAALQPARDPTVPVAIARSALERARGLQDRPLLCEVLRSVGSALVEFAPVEETLALAKELLALAVEGRDHEATLRAYARVALDQLRLSEHEAYVATLDDMVAHARRLGHPRLLWRPLLLSAMHALAQGRFGDAEQLRAELQELSRLTDDPALGFAMMAHGLYLPLALDRPEEAVALLARHGPQIDATAGPEVRALIRSMIASRARDAAEARRHLPLLASRLPALVIAPEYAVIWGEAAALAGTREERELAYASTLRESGREAHTGHVVCTYEGPVDRTLALLEASLGRHAEALSRLDAATACARRSRFAPWVARMSLERGEIALAAGRPEEARASLAEALELATSLGMPTTAARAREALGASEPALPARAAPPRASSTPRLALAREGELWRVVFEGRELRLKDSRGMQMLARLVDAPGERIHALVLEGNDVAQSSVGDAIDATAARAYKRRIEELREALEAAEATGNASRAGRIERELEQLREELSRSLGLGGKARKLGSSGERARVNVTRRLKDAIARIAELDARAGKHLEVAVRTGTYCVYHA